MMLVKMPVLDAQAWSGVLQCAGVTEDAQRNTKLLSAGIMCGLLPCVHFGGDAWQVIPKSWETLQHQN
jgi:hypothetical protein